MAEPIIQAVAPTKILPEGFQAAFSDDSGLSLEFLFLPFGDGDLVMVAYVRSPHHHDPINLNDWSRLHGVKGVEHLFKVKLRKDDAGDLERFAEALGNILNHPLMSPILAGSAWEDIPFDWTGIK